MLIKFANKKLVKIKYYVQSSNFGCSKLSIMFVFMFGFADLQEQTAWQTLMIVSLSPVGMVRPVRIKSMATLVVVLPGSLAVTVRAISMNAWHNQISARMAVAIIYCFVITMEPHLCQDNVCVNLWTWSCHHNFPILNQLLFDNLWVLPEDQAMMIPVGICLVMLT